MIYDLVKSVALCPCGVNLWKDLTQSKTQNELQNVKQTFWGTKGEWRTYFMDFNFVIRCKIQEYKQVELTASPSFSQER